MVDLVSFLHSTPSFAALIAYFSEIIAYNVWSNILIDILAKAVSIRKNSNCDCFFKGADEIADSIVYLLSDRASNITGTKIVTDGGMLVN